MRRTTEDGLQRARPSPRSIATGRLLRALTSTQPLLAPRNDQDPAVVGWLAEHGYRDAMLVAFPAEQRIRHDHRDRPARRDRHVHRRTTSRCCRP